MTDKELISEIVKGNQLYFKILVDQYQSLVLNTCYNFVHNTADAEDITQEVFIDVYLSIKKFKDQSKLSTWLYRIAVNKSLNFIRNNKKRSIFRSIENFFFSNDYSSLEIPNEPDINNNLEDHELKKLNLLREAIQKLSESQKIAFTLHKFENVPYKEIASIMDMSLASIEGLIFRANKNVQKYILKHYKK